MSTFSWQGNDNVWREFDVARSKRLWDPIGGIYMFVKPSDSPTMEAGGPVALYIGETDSFADSLSRHDLWAAAQQLGAAEIHLLEVREPAARSAICAGLQAAHTPILNRQMLRRVA